MSFGRREAHIPLIGVDPIAVAIAHAGHDQLLTGLVDAVGDGNGFGFRVVAILPEIIVDVPALAPEAALPVVLELVRLAIHPGDGERHRRVDHGGGGGVVLLNHAFPFQFKGKPGRRRHGDEFLLHPGFVIAGPGGVDHDDAGLVEPVGHPAFLIVVARKADGDGEDAVIVAHFLRKVSKG